MASAWDDADARNSKASSSGQSFLQRVKNAVEDDDDYDMPPGGVVAPGNGELDDANLTLVQQLMRHWLNERFAPEILQCQHQLLNDILDFVAEQGTLVTRLRSDPETSEEEHFQMMLVQTEVERVKFVTRSYMRARLFKIEKHAAYIMSHPELHTRLSSTELQHARRYSTLLGNHFRSSVLTNLPQSIQALDDDLSDTGIPPMVTPPSIKYPVFIRALKDCGEIPVADGHTLTISKGSIHLLPYEVIQALLLSGDLELL